jgi:5-methylcytosine-specific restriction endonuclease McrA
MKKHTKVYLEHFNLDKSDWIGCEVCNNTAVDIHHINARGMGGSEQKDDVINLMALCRECHNYFGDKKKFKKMLFMMHVIKMDDHEKLNVFY